MLLLASVLAIGAGSIAGCGDMADCPAAVAQGTSCTSNGLSCFQGADTCTCSGGAWSCKLGDAAVPDLAAHDLRVVHDLPFID
ncbi:MAG: hypothetical protein ACXVDD_14930 [Polyangia bacterium]